MYVFIFKAWGIQEIIFGTERFSKTSSKINTELYLLQWVQSEYVCGNKFPTKKIKFFDKNSYEKCKSVGAKVTHGNSEAMDYLKLCYRSKQCTLLCFLLSCGKVNIPLFSVLNYSCLSFSTFSNTPWELAEMANATWALTGAG